MWESMKDEAIGGSSAQPSRPEEPGLAVAAPQLFGEALVTELCW